MYLHSRVSLKTILQIVLLFSYMTFNALSFAENLKTDGRSVYQYAYGEGYTTDGRYFYIAGNYNFNSDSWGTYENRSVYFYLDGVGFFYQDVNASDLVFDTTTGTVSINAVVGGYPVSVTFTGEQKDTRSKSNNFSHGTGFKYHGHSTSITNEDMTMTGTLAGSTIDITNYAYFSDYRSSWKQMEK